MAKVAPTTHQCPHEGDYGNPEEEEKLWKKEKSQDPRDGQILPLKDQLQRAEKANQEANADLGKARTYLANVLKEDKEKEAAIEEKITSLEEEKQRPSGTPHGSYQSSEGLERTHPKTGTIRSQRPRSVDNQGSRRLDQGNSRRGRSTRTNSLRQTSKK